MNKSDSIAALAAALAKAQGEMGHASKDATNPHFRSKYSDLAAVVEAIKGPLSNNGIAYTQLCDFTESGGLVIETALLHESGEWISSRLSIPVPKMDPQGVGSAISYAKRYSLAAIVGLASDEDDDAEGAMGRGAQQSKSSPAPTKENGSQPKIELSKPQNELLSTLVDYCQGNEQRMAEVLKECSHYDKDGKSGELTLKDLKTPKDSAPFQRWVGATLGKLRTTIQAEADQIPFG